MKVLIAADGSDYTKRMFACIAAHDEWLGSKHQNTVLHCVAALPHRVAAFAGLPSALTGAVDQDQQAQPSEPIAAAASVAARGMRHQQTNQRLHVEFEGQDFQLVVSVAPAQEGHLYVIPLAGGPRRLAPASSLKLRGFVGSQSTRTLLYRDPCV